MNIRTSDRTRRALALAALLPLLLAWLPARAPAQLYGRKPDYSNPQLYLAAGPQSAVQASPEELRAEIGLSTAPAADELVPAVFGWLAAGFKASAEGGRLIGKTTADGLLRSRSLSGCHDWALVFSAVLRRLGYPALMADAAGIKWAKEHKSGGSFSGHVFVEAYLDGRWMLIDAASGRYVKEYDPSNPVIPLAVGGESEGLYVLFKGLDPRAYGISADGALRSKMEAFAARLPGLRLNYPAYKVLAPRGPAQGAPQVREEDADGPCRQTPCARRPGRGTVVQVGKWDLLVEKKDGAYYAHRYPYGLIFNAPEAGTEKFATLKAVNDYLAGLAEAGEKKD